MSIVMPKLEMCVDNLESAFIAAKSGVERLEVCEDLSVGGLTPSIEFIKDVQKMAAIPVFILIRPRPGNFTYNQCELEKMIEDINKFKELNVDGLVFGALDKDNNVNRAFCQKLLAASSGIPATFHRAFDQIADKSKALEEIISLGFQRILTTGGPQTAEEGIQKLRELMSQAGNRIIIMPGGSITDDNIYNILQNTAAIEVHSSGRIADKDTKTLKSKVCSVKMVKMMLHHCAMARVYI